MADRGADFSADRGLDNARLKARLWNRWHIRPLIDPRLMWRVERSEDGCRPLACSKGMEFEWDEAKNSAGLERRGFDFAYAVRAFLDPQRIIAQDRRPDHGEDRYQVLGTVDGRACVIVRTVRGSAVRIISARKANRKEVTDHEHNAHQD